MSVFLEMNEKQAETIKRALELYARIGMGQLHDLERHTAIQEQDYNRDETSKIITELKQTIFNDLHGRGHSYGIRHEKTHEESKEAYDMYQVIRHTLAWNRHPEGKSWNVDFDKPEQFSKQDLIKCEIK